MESALTKACTIKITNFEGPFDLLFHLIEKSQFSIYDIPINDITDQYMDYLFAMQELDMEVASEFIVMAATLMHIKSKMLLPDKKEKNAEEVDPREELIMKLVLYKRYKEFSGVLKDRERYWEKAYYKLPEVMDFKWNEELLELSPSELQRIMKELMERNRKKRNNVAPAMKQIMQIEKVSLRSKMREVVRNLLNRAFFKFAEIFTLKTKSKTEVVTGFMAILELSKLKKVTLEQKSQFSDIMVHRNTDELIVHEFDDIEEEKVV